MRLASAILVLTACGSDPGSTVDAEVGSADAAPDAAPASVHVRVTGAGHGTVHSGVGSLACTQAGGTCDANLIPGAPIDLVGTPDPGYVFAGWNGDGCHGGGPCSVTAAGTVHAVFTMPLAISQRALDGSDSAGAVANIFTVLLDGTGLTAITHYTVATVNGSAPVWSPDGTRIAFTGTGALDGSDTIGGTNIWVIDADGMHATALTNTTNTTTVGTPVWSPDGTLLAYTQASATESGLWLMHADGTSPREIVPGGANVAFAGLAWSPDGTLLAFSSSLPLDGSTSAPLDHHNIWVVNADGTHLVDVTATTAQASSTTPLWSPDGAHLAFASMRAPDGSDTRNPSLNIWIGDPSGAGIVAITRNAVATNVYQAWAPDGAHLVFASNQALDGSDTTASANLWIAGADGSGRAPLAPSTKAGSVLPLWSPDGASIVFESNRALDGSDAVAASGILNAWSVAPDGTGLHAITTTAAANTNTIVVQLAPTAVAP